METKDGKVLVSRTAETRAGKSCHGLARSLLANAVHGVSKGFTKELEIEGVGFRAAIEGKKVTMLLGFSSPVELEIPEGINITEKGGTSLTVTGVDKQKVGNVTARLRSFFPAEPYKGKGIRYKGQYVRRKVGKTVA